MTGVVLTILDAPETASALLLAATRLAQLSGNASVRALIIRTPPIATILPTEEVLTRRQEERVRAREAGRAALLADAFQEWRRAGGHAAQLDDIEATASEVVAKQGAASDFLVIGQKAQEDYGTNWQATHAALFETDRPVLIVPPDASNAFGRRVALAWRDDQRTIRATLTALRCFKQAERLFVLTGYREGQPIPPIPDILDEHRAVAELRALRIEGRLFGQTLLAAAHACHADVLVMGAFVHTPMRRLILGGVTKYMLAHADLPLLLRH
jgi:nucleotide-binding universal stress UspA family protein